MGTRVNSKKYNSGFSLIEIIVVFAIITILTAIAVPLFRGILKNEVQRVVCDYNCLQLEKTYEAHLSLENIKHSEASFINHLQKYGQDICSEGDDIRYRNEKVVCIVHSVDDGSEEDSSDDDGIKPYL